MENSHVIANKQTKGKCLFCGRDMTRGGMIRHLPSCEQRRQAIDEKEYDRRIEQDLYHLQVSDPYSSDYWLNLEINGTAKLADFDDYLRAIWLECCDHMSQFSDEGEYGREVAMTQRVFNVFKPGVEMTHIYDFGSSTVTVIKMVGKRRGMPLTSNPVFLMARNNPPEYICEECDKPASWFDMEALFNMGQFICLCNEHAESDPDGYTDEYIEIVNSPRTGVCGYTGPAEPPY